MGLHNIYHVEHVETDEHVLFLIPEYATNHFSLPNFTAPVMGTLNEVMNSYTRTRYKYP